MFRICFRCGITMDNLVRVDLEKRSAKVKMFLLSVSNVSPEETGQVMSLLSGMDDLVITSEKGKVTFEIDFDFGPYIPKEVWEMRHSRLIESFMDVSLSAQWDGLCEEAVLECVKKMYPDVASTIKETVEKKIREWSHNE